MPSEMMNTYDMIVKTLPMPVFEMKRYSSSKSLYQILNEITSKMAHYYFSIYQALFAKDTKEIILQQQKFLDSDDPFIRANQITFLYSDFIEMLDKKMYYLNKTAQEFKEKSKKAMLENAFQKILSENKETDKEKYDKKLKAITTMPESVRKLL